MRYHSKESLDKVYAAALEFLLPKHLKQTTDNGVNQISHGHYHIACLMLALEGFQSMCIRLKKSYGSAKRAGDKLESDKSMKQKTNENEEGNFGQVEKRYLLHNINHKYAHKKLQANYWNECVINYSSSCTAGTKVYAAGLQLLEELLLSEG
ncbi:hypothetical protein Tco_0134669 [Tanacetum coccineum]